MMSQVPIKIHSNIPFGVVPNYIAQDSSLTFEARGMLTYLLSKPQGWQTYRKDLINASPASEHVISRIIRELKDHYYLRLEVSSKGRGKISRHLIFYWNPCDNPDNPALDPNFSSYDSSSDDMSSGEKAPNIIRKNLQRENLEKKNLKECSEKKLSESAPDKNPQKLTTKQKHKHPAIQAYREKAHCYPIGSWKDIVIETVGDAPEDIEFWGIVVEAYIGCSYSPKGLEGMVDYYKRREIPTTKPKGQSNGANTNGRTNRTGISNIGEQPDTFGPTRTIF